MEETNEGFDGHKKGIDATENTNMAPAIGEVDLDERNILHEHYEKLTPFTWFLCATSAIGALLFGYDTGVISTALVNIGDDIGGKELNSTQSEWVTASLSAGAFIGSLLGGNIIDRYGRKKVLGFADILFVLGAVLIAASYHLVQIILGRVVMGFAVGIAAAVTPLYLGELAPTRLRGALVSIQAFMITGGQVLSYALGAAMTFHGGWRALFAISIVPAAIQAGFIHFLPESPRFQLLQGRDDEAAKTLSRIYSQADGDFISTKIRFMHANIQHSRSFQEKYPILPRLRLIFTHGRYFRPVIIAGLLMLSQQLCGFNSLMYYSGTLFSYVGFSNAAATGLVVAATNFIFTIVAMMIMDRIGKRTLLLISYPGMILGLTLAAVAFSQMTSSTGGQLIEGSDYPIKWTNMMLGMMVIFIAFYAVGLGNVPWQSPELFPLEIRGFGASVMTACNWAGNLIISSTFLSLMERITPAGAFGFYAGLCLLGLIFVIFCYPECTGLSLEEIHDIFERGFGIKEAKQLRQKHHDTTRAKALDNSSSIKPVTVREANEI